MSKGNKIVCLRIDSVMMQEIAACIRNRNAVTRESEWSRTDFILKAIKEKIHHMDRARKSRKRKPQ